MQSPLVAAHQISVAGSKTTLKSPTIDLSGYGDAIISYRRWYSNSAGNAPNSDTFPIDISNYNGTSWTNVETVGLAGAGTSGQSGRGRAWSRGSGCGKSYGNRASKNGR